MSLGGGSAQGQTVGAVHCRAPDICPQAEMVAFLEQLKKEGVFAKEVRTGGMAFHSYFMEAIAPTLLQALKKVGRLPSGGCVEAGRRQPRPPTDRAVCAGDPGA